MQQLIFILVNPGREENIGASARAMNTMGITNLYLVSPQANHLGKRALATAHGSQDILKNALIFDSFTQAIEGVDLVIGSAAKKRSVAQAYHPIDDLATIILAKGDTVSKVAIVFGSEESGLTNEHLSQCHLLTTIPMQRMYPSLNLAQSVMVYAHHLSKLTLVKHKNPKLDVREAELSVVRNKAKQVLEDVGIDPEQLVYPRIMERLLMLEKDDINLFHTFCKYYLKKYHNRLK